MKRKSLVAILLAIVLCFTVLLVACDENDGDDSRKRREKSSSSTELDEEFGNGGTLSGLDAWPSKQIRDVMGEGIPAYSGGDSFDIEDIGSETVKTEKAAIEEAIAILETYESMLGAEEKAELAALRTQLSYFDEIECYAITVYGTNSDQADAYEDALTASGFSNGVKRTEDYEIEISVSEDDGKAIITVSRVPIELLEGFDDGEGATSEKTGLPDNIKISYHDGVYEVTAIKLGEDYAVQRGVSGYFECAYYKKNGSGWDVYEKEMFETEWMMQEEQETDRHWVERRVFDFIVDGVEGEKTGNETLLGRTVEVFVDDFSSPNYSYSYTYYRDMESGLVLKAVMVNPAGTITYFVNSIDTEVNSFEDIDLP